MLKTSYDREDLVPENLKGAYVADASGKYVLDQLDAEHPIVRKNTEIVQEKTRAVANATKLADEKAVLEARSIPEGHIAVKAEDASIIEKFKATGVSLDELPNLKSENESFKAEKSAADGLRIRKAAGKKLGFNEEKFAVLAKDMQIAEDGENFVVVSGSNGTTEKKPLTKELIESSDVFKPFIDSLTTTPQNPGNQHEPRPSGLPADTQADATAKAAQARSTRNHF